MTSARRTYRARPTVTRPRRRPLPQTAGREARSFGRTAGQEFDALGRATRRCAWSWIQTTPSASATPGSFCMTRRRAPVAISSASHTRS